MTWRPTTPEEALAAATHKALGYPHRPQPGCCHFFEIELVGAGELVVELDTIGWLPPRPATSIPESVPAGEPRTAASRIEDVSDRAFAVWFCLDVRGGLTDEELTKRYEMFASASWFRPQTPQSIRSRRAELVRAGHVEATGERRPTKSGGTAAVWCAVGSAQEVAA